MTTEESILADFISVPYFIAESLRWNERRAAEHRDYRSFGRRSLRPRFHAAHKHNFAFTALVIPVGPMRRFAGYHRLTMRCMFSHAVKEIKRLDSRCHRDRLQREPRYRTRG